MAVVGISSTACAGRRPAEGLDEIVVCLELDQRSLVSRRLGLARRLQRFLDIGGVGVTGADPVLAQEVEQAIANAGGLELVGENR